MRLCPATAEKGKEKRKRRKEHCVVEPTYQETVLRPPGADDQAAVEDGGGVWPVLGKVEDGEHHLGRELEALLQHHLRDDHVDCRGLIDRRF